MSIRRDACGGRARRDQGRTKTSTTPEPLGWGPAMAKRGGEERQSCRVVDVEKGESGNSRVDRRTRSNPVRPAMSRHDRRPERRPSSWLPPRSARPRILSFHVIAEQFQLSDFIGCNGGLREGLCTPLAPQRHSALSPTRDAATRRFTKSSVYEKADLQVGLIHLFC